MRDWARSLTNAVSRALGGGGGGGTASTSKDDTQQPTQSPSELKEGNLQSESQTIARSEKNPGLKLSSSCEANPSVPPVFWDLDTTQSVPSYLSDSGECLEKKNKRTNLSF